MKLFLARFDPDDPNPDLAGQPRPGDGAARSTASPASTRTGSCAASYPSSGPLLRTNYFRRDGHGLPRPYLSFKLDPAQIPVLPKPWPKFEIFVYSPRFEAVHLRGGKVARGGIRWSDRPEDFRTEVLGLMKAQMVKNALIVPVGAKGGFVLKRPPAASGPELAPGGDRLLPGVPVRAARPHRQHRRRRRCRRPSGWCATTTTIPTSSWRPTRARRSSRTSPTRSPPATGSGSATRSPRAARTATTTSRWGSPLAGRGSRSSGTSASSGPTSRRPTSRSSGSATCRATCSATGCSARRTSGWWRRSTTRTCSSTPTPTQRPASQERKRLFELERSGWTDYDAGLISGGAVCTSAGQVDTDLGQGAGDAGDRGRAALAGRPDQGDPARSGRPVVERRDRHLCQGGRASPAQTWGTRPTTPCGSTDGELRCRVVGEGGNLGLTQLGRIEYARAAGPTAREGGSTPTRSTTWPVSTAQTRR